MRLDLVDVFCGGPLGGNPLAVVHGAEGLTAEDMQALARWLGFSETSFLLPPDDPAADYRLRIFTPVRELPFAGHPTLGSAFAWRAAGGVPRVPGVVLQECGAGLIEVRLGNAPGRLAFRAPPLRRSGPLSPAELAEAARVAGVDPASVVEAVHGDNGPPWQILRLASVAEVLAARPAARAAEPTDIGLIAPHAAGGEGDWRDADWPGDWPDADWEVRAFVVGPGGHVYEDPVTGSLNAAVALYLYERGLATGDYVAAQGRCVGAKGRVYVTRDADGAGSGGNAWIGGDVAMVAAGARLTV